MTNNYNDAKPLYDLLVEKCGNKAIKVTRFNIDAGQKNKIKEFVIDEHELKLINKAYESLYRGKSYTKSDKPIEEIA